MDMYAARSSAAFCNTESFTPVKSAKSPDTTYVLYAIFSKLCIVPAEYIWKKMNFDLWKRVQFEAL